MAWLILLIIILIVLIVWWALLRSAKEYKPDFEVHGHEEGAAHIEGEIPAETKAPVAAAPAAPEDLTLIEGIGPKVKQVLYEAGIQTFAQLAAADVDRLRHILEQAGLRFMDPSTWPQQAHLAAQGKMDELQALQGQLKGGRSAA